MVNKMRLKNKLEPKNSPELKKELRKILAEEFPDYFTLTIAEKRACKFSPRIQIRLFGKRTEEGRRAIANALSAIRKEKGYDAQKYNLIEPVLALIDFLEYHVCDTWELLRKTPPKEQAMAMIIILQCLQKEQRYFARALFIGTPTAVTINKMIHSFRNKLIKDNLWVALVLLLVSDILTICIGDTPPSGVERDGLNSLNRVEAKIRQWLRLLPEKGNFIIGHCPITPKSFEEKIKSEVELAKKEPVLIVYMASGATTGYMDRALQLSKEYPNLEILHMAAGGYAAKYVWKVFSIRGGEKRELKEKIGKKELAKYIKF